jgi:hypothetical protein
MTTWQQTTTAETTVSTWQRLRTAVVRGRSAALAGIIGPPLFVGLVVIITLLEWDFLQGIGWRLLENTSVPYPSALSLGAYGWLQVINFALFGLLCIHFTLGLHGAIHARKGARVSTALLLLAGSASLLCAFVTEPDTNHLPVTWHSMLHLVGFLLLLVALTLAPFALAWRLRSDARWRGFEWYAVITGVLVILGAIYSPPVGFYVSIITFLVWIEVMAWRLWVLAASPKTW